MFITPFTNTLIENLGCIITAVSEEKPLLLVNTFLAFTLISHNDKLGPPGCVAKQFNSIEVITQTRSEAYKKCVHNLP